MPLHLFVISVIILQYYFLKSLVLLFPSCVWSFWCYMSIFVVVVEAHKIESSPRESSVNGRLKVNQPFNLKRLVF